ncbi:MAG: phosphomannomutase [Eubacteriales bacterium]
MLYNPDFHKKIRLIVFDADGTLTGPRVPLESENRAVLEALAPRYRLAVNSAGHCRRIFEQLGHFPVDIIGNYGTEESVCIPGTETLCVKSIRSFPCDRSETERLVDELRSITGYTAYRGAGVCFHDSGCITIPLLGTQAQPDEKNAFDPDRKKRRAILPIVRGIFPSRNVYIGGTASLDLTPRGFDKYTALCRYCAEHGYAHDEVLFAGDDFGEGGNDKAVYDADIAFLPVDDYRMLKTLLKPLLQHT